MQFWLSNRAVSIVVAVLASSISVPAMAATWFVDKSAPGGIGNSWGQAFKFLQDALQNFQLGNNDQIWVAAGTYFPDEDFAHPNGTADAEATFNLPGGLLGGVAIYGGFLGGETLLSQRDPETNTTILSGIVGAIEGTFHVVTSQNGGNVRLDGFTIQGGDAGSGAGAGLSGTGGGMVIDAASPRVVRCTFRGNFAAKGGGVFVRALLMDSLPTFVNCSFIGNRATETVGGGMCVEALGVPNEPFGIARLELHNCVFSGNTAQSGGAGLSISKTTVAQTSRATIINCTFTENQTNSSGSGGIDNGELARCGEVILHNSILWRNGLPSNGFTEQDQIDVACLL